MIFRKQIFLIFICLILFSGCGSHPASEGTDDSTLTADSPAPPISMKPYLARHFKLMDRSNVEAELQDSLEELRRNPGIAKEVSGLYDELTALMPKASKDKFLITGVGHARWRAVHLLGSLGKPEAVPTLVAITKTALPDPEKSSEELFKVEYRIRLRCIAGLEKLGAVEALKEIHGRGGLLKGPAAASLFQLGHKLDGVYKLDPAKVIGSGDPTDHHTKSKERKQMLTIPQVKQQPGMEEGIAPVIKPRDDEEDLK